MTALVVLTPDELRALVRDAVAEALAERPSEPEPSPFLSLAAFARIHGVSKRTAATWRRDGLPCALNSAGRVRVDVARADEWLRERTARRERGRVGRVTESAKRAAERAA